MADSELTPAKYSPEFWSDMADRALSTAAQTTLGIATAAGFDLLNFDVPGALAVIGTATAISVLKALAVERKAAAIYRR